MPRNRPQDRLAKLTARRDRLAQELLKLDAEIARLKAPQAPPVTVETVAYLRSWAAALVAVGGPGEARAAIRIYSAQARDKRIPAADRKAAARRARYLRESLRKT